MFTFITATQIKPNRTDPPPRSSFVGNELTGATSTLIRIDPSFKTLSVYIGVFGNCFQKRFKNAIWRSYEVTLIFNDAIKPDNRHNNCSTTSSTVLYVGSWVGHVTVAWISPFSQSALQLEKGVTRARFSLDSCSISVWMEGQSVEERDTFSNLTRINADVARHGWCTFTYTTLQSV